MQVPPANEISEQGAKGAQARIIYLRDLVLLCNIGVHHHEKGRPQRVRVNIELALTDDVEVRAHGATEMPDPEDLVMKVVAANDHINLAETLAECIASICLECPAFRSARVRVEKLDIFKDAAGAGVEIERVRSDAGGQGRKYRN